MSTTKSKVDYDYTTGKVAQTGRKSNLSMFMIMLGFTFFSASMWVGQQMAAGLDFKGFLLAMLLGGLILGAYTGALGYIGAESGLTLEAWYRQKLAGSHLLRTRRFSLFGGIN